MTLPRSRGGSPGSRDAVSGRNPGSPGEGASLTVKVPLREALPQAIVYALLPLAPLSLPGAPSLFPSHPFSGERQITQTSSCSFCAVQSACFYKPRLIHPCVNPLCKLRRVFSLGANSCVRTPLNTNGQGKDRNHVSLCE